MSLTFVKTLQNCRLYCVFVTTDSKMILDAKSALPLRNQFLNIPQLTREIKCRNKVGYQQEQVYSKIAGTVVGFYQCFRDRNMEHGFLPLSGNSNFNFIVLTSKLAKDPLCGHFLNSICRLRVDQIFLSHICLLLCHRHYRCPSNTLFLNLFFKPFLRHCSETPQNDLLRPRSKRS